MKKKIALADCKYRSDRRQDCAGLPSKEYGRKTVQHRTQSSLTGFCNLMLKQEYQWQSDASTTETVHFEKRSKSLKLTYSSKFKGKKSLHF